MLSKDTLQFFRELRENNHKIWFDENRKRYELVKKEYHSLIANILEKLKVVDPTLDHLEVKNCTFRINRDIRFSKDKTPYKTHLAIGLNAYGKKLQYAGYYVHMEEGKSFLGGGVYMPDAENLKKIRKEVAFFYDDFLGVIHDEKFKRTYGDLDRSPGIELTRPPKGFEADDPAIEYLKLKSFTATRPMPDDMLTNPNSVDKVVSMLGDLKPYNDFLNRGLLSDENGAL